MKSVLVLFQGLCPRVSAPTYPMLRYVICLWFRCPGRDTLKINKQVSSIISMCTSRINFYVTRGWLQN